LTRNRLLATGLLLAVLAAHHAHAGTLSVVGPDRWAHVAYVYDGDTIRTDDGEKVRLLGINAPEVAHGDEPGQPLGEAAGKRLKALVLDREVRLQTDEDKHDVYGRLLAHVYLRDGTWIDGLLVKEGLAHVYIFPPNFRHAEALLHAEDVARGRRLGIWATGRFRVLAAAEVDRSQAGQFRVVEGAVSSVHRNGLGFRLGRLNISIPRAYRRYFPARLRLARGMRVRVRGTVRVSGGRHLYLALHSPFNLSIISMP
jgi:endonuclease YncB( thermonuclease family)